MREEDRIISASDKSVDEFQDNAIRPAKLKDYIGQRSANHGWVEGIRDGNGNKVRQDT